MLEQMAEQVEEQDYKDWLSLPVTRLYLQLLRAWKESIKDQWAKGNFEDNTIEGTAQMNASARGSVAILDQLLEMDYEQFNEGIDSE